MDWSTLSASTILFPFVAGMYFYKKLDDLSRWFYFFIVFTFFFETFTTYLASKGIHNIWYIHSFMVLEFFFFPWYFYKSLNGDKVIVLTTALGFILLLVAEFMLFSNSKPFAFDSMFIIVVYLHLVIQSAYYLLKHLDFVAQSPLSVAGFWVGLAVFFYFLINTSSFAVAKYIVENKNSNLLIIPGSLGNALHNILFGISFLSFKTAK